MVSQRGIRVGDRIQIEEVKGDVIDLTLFRLTMLEVGNWVLGEQSTGRMVVFPNSFVFKKHFYNYTSGHQYLWEEISVEITFESNWKRAKLGLQTILEEETREVLAAARLDMRRAAEKIFLRTGVLTPIVWISIVDSGVRLGLRYLTQTRTRRSQSSRTCERILDFINATPDIQLAYFTRRQIQEVVKPSRNFSLQAADSNGEPRAQPDSKARGET